MFFFLKKSTYGHKQPHNLEFEALNFTSVSYNPSISKLSTEGQILNIFIIEINKVYFGSISQVGNLWNAFPYG